MIKVPINDNYVMPSFQTVNKNQPQTDLILMDPQNTTLYLLHQYYCTHAEDYAELIALLETQANQGVESPYLLNPLVYLPIKYTNEQFQTTHFVQVLYEYGSHTLEQQLYLRIGEKNYFEEHEIWSILGSIVLGLKNLKDKEFTHSSVCTGDVFVTKQGQIKICHPMFRTYDHNNSQQVEPHYFERAIQQNYYFAPEQLPNYHRQPTNNIKNLSPLNKHQHQYEDQSEYLEVSLDSIFKSDIFSAGMTVISLCLLHPINDCYVKRGSKKSSHIHLSTETLAHYFNAIQTVYSQDLIGILFAMVAYSTEDRICIDELAFIIQQMIEAKQLQEENQNRPTQSNQLPTRYEEDAKGSIIRKNHQVKSDEESEEKFGKFSRVRQASPLSGRKTSRSTHNYGGPLKSIHPDQQDKPSVPSIECDIDYPNVDIGQFDTLNESQAKIDSQNETLQDEKTSQQSKTLRSLQNGNKNILQSQQSFNQTLRQYINHENSSILEVNQTRTQEQNERKGKQEINPFSPQYVQSVMTSKQLSSLPSDSASIVVEKQVINGQFIEKNVINRQFIENPGSNRQLMGKQNEFNFGSTLVKMVQSKQPASERKQLISQGYDKYSAQTNKEQAKSRSINNLKLFLNNIKQHNNQPPMSYRPINHYPSNGICSARTHSEQTKQNNFITANNLTKITELKGENNNASKMICSSSKDLLNFSLNKEYETFMEMQNKNPSKLYTDPEFLKAIREDVNKILKKRTTNITSTPNPQNPLSHNHSANQIFINGKKVSHPSDQHIIFRPISNNISQFR